MVLTDLEKERLENIYQSLLHDPRILAMEDIPMHRGSNCYLHTFKVTKRCFKKALKKKNMDLEALLFDCIFHDYYLYDWRKHREYRKHHGKHHPSVSIENARRDFNLSDKAAEIIRTHMWPINFRDFPKSKEGRLLCGVDTWVATIEFLTTKGHKKAHESKYLEHISKLFD